MKQNMPITKEKIIAASWELLRGKGIENFTMRKLAEQLDIKAASLYWHFKSKQHIFQVLAEEVAKHILLAERDDGDWKEQLFQFGVNMRKQLQAYPCSAQLLMQTMPSAPEYVALFEHMLVVVDKLSLKDKDKFSSIACFMDYILAFELDAYERNKVRLEITQDIENKEQKSYLNLSIYKRDSSFKILHRMHFNGMFKNMGSDDMFETGLKIIILGIEQLT